MDVAGGTGDIAIRLLDHARDRHGDRETSVQVLDINAEMLEEGKKRFAKTMYHGGEYLPFCHSLAVRKSSPCLFWNRSTGLVHTWER